MIWIGPGPHGNAAAAVAHSLHVGFYNKAETLAVETAVKCIVVHPICGADLKDEAEIRGPAAADPVPDRTRVKHHVQPFVFPGHGKKGIIGDPIPMETDLKSTGFLIRFQGNMGLSLPQGQREGAQMRTLSLYGCIVYEAITWDWGTVKWVLSRPFPPGESAPRPRSPGPAGSGSGDAGGSAAHIGRSGGTGWAAPPGPAPPTSAG